MPSPSVKHTSSAPEHDRASSSPPSSQPPHDTGQLAAIDSGPNESSHVNPKETIKSSQEKEPIPRSSHAGSSGSSTPVNKTSKDVPPEPEKIRPDSSEHSTPVTRVPEPAGIDEPVNENASTVLLLAETAMPFAAASPPDAPEAHPS